MKPLIYLILWFIFPALHSHPISKLDDNLIFSAPPSDEIVLPAVVINDLIYIRPIQAVAWSEDGRYLAIASADVPDTMDGLIHIYDSQQKTLNLLTDETPLITEISWCCSDQTLITASHQAGWSYHAWDVETGAQVFKSHDFLNGVSLNTRLIVSPDREWVAVHRPRFYSLLMPEKSAHVDLWVWSVADGRVVAQSEPSLIPYKLVAWSPDSRALLIHPQEGERLMLWDFINDQDLLTWDMPIAVNALSWSSQNQLAIASFDRVLIWDMNQIDH